MPFWGTCQRNNKVLSVVSAVNAKVQKKAPGIAQFTPLQNIGRRCMRRECSFENSSRSSRTICSEYETLSCQDSRIVVSRWLANLSTALMSDPVLIAPHDADLVIQKAHTLSQLFRAHLTGEVRIIQRTRCRIRATPSVRSGVFVQNESKTRMPHQKFAPHF